MDIDVVIASINDIDNIIELYKERTEWFKNKKINQWSKYLIHHPKEEFIEAINNKTYYIVKQNNQIIGGFNLTTYNNSWNDINTPAYYICRVVSKVGYKNLGKTIIYFSKQIAKEDNKKYLRLECLRYNDKLNIIYENHGFKLIRYGKNKLYSYALREMIIE